MKRPKQVRKGTRVMLVKKKRPGFKTKLKEKVDPNKRFRAYLVSSDFGKKSYSEMSPQCMSREEAYGTAHYEVTYRREPFNKVSRERMLDRIEVFEEQLGQPSRDISAAPTKQEGS